MRSLNPVFLVEDDEVDVLSMQRAFDELSIPNSLVIRNNGEEALDYLLSDPSFRPSIMIVDLNMPKMGGLELLHKMRDEPRLRNIPVIVLSSSATESDRCASFQLGISGYMVKPVDYSNFVEQVRVIDKYWTFSENADCCNQNFKNN